VSSHSYLTDAERASLDETVRRAETLCRAEFSVFVGRSVGAPRAFATSLHNSLVAPSRSVVVMVDPQQRVVEIVTGGWVRRTLADHQVELAVQTMTRTFAESSLLDGLRRGIQQLADHARSPRTLHAGPESA